MKILAVDDDDISLEILTQALTESGHEVLTASDGADATGIIEKDEVRFVISDWMMPGMDGLELCKWIRTQGFPWYVYVIMLTARNQTDDVIVALSAGADEFLPKPFNPGELDVRIRTGERILSLETRHVAIFALAKLAESRDPETGKHLERIREYSRVIARYVASHDDFREGLAPDFAETVYLTSPLHDIGKVGIPDFILLKPGRLADAEFAVMKSHTIVGSQTLEAASRQYPGVQYLRIAKDIAHSHHERFNGTGYPDGREGEDIPLCSRVVALADVYDALMSKRVYKAAYSHDIARSIILEEKGRHFDPRVVDAFIEQESVFMEIGDRFSEQSANTLYAVGAEA